MKHKVSMINCVHILHREGMITDKEKERLIEGIIEDRERAFKVVSHKLEQLSLRKLTEDEYGKED